MPAWPSSGRQGTRCDASCTACRRRSLPRPTITTSGRRAGALPRVPATTCSKVRPCRSAALGPSDLNGRQWTFSVGCATVVARRVTQEVRHRADRRRYRADRRDRDLGGRRAGARVRDYAHRRDGAAPVRSGIAGMDEDRLPPRRHPRSRFGRRTGRRRRRRGAPRVPDHGFACAESPGQPGRQPQRLRGGRSGTPSGAARLHLVRGRVRVLLGQPRPVDRGCARPGSKEHYYSEQKAECEALLRTTTDGSGLEVYVLRPCIVAGPKATALADSMPWRQFRQRLPAVLRPVASLIEGMLPLLPDPGVVMHLVHHDDVAAAIALAVGVPVDPVPTTWLETVSCRCAKWPRATGTRSIRVPRILAVAASRVVAGLPMLPAAAEWIDVARSSVVMDTSRAKNELGWRPRYTSRETLAALAEVL